MSIRIWKVRVCDQIHDFFPSHLWVIAMKVAEDMQLPDNPLSLFPNNDSFVFYSDGNIGTQQPYVIAEMESSAYNNLSTSGFVLGDPENTSSLNDNSLYLNGPLNQSTSYTVFVWGFSPTPAVSVVDVVIVVVMNSPHLTGWIQ